MGISRYPRVGQRIAPATLREILNVAIPRKILGSEIVPYSKLADLDETVWRWLPELTCRRLADEVVQQVRRRFLCLFKEFGNRVLPKIRT